MFGKRVMILGFGCFVSIIDDRSKCRDVVFVSRTSQVTNNLRLDEVPHLVDFTNSRGLHLHEERERLGTGTCRWFRHDGSTVTTAPNLDESLRLKHAKRFAQGGSSNFKLLGQVFFGWKSITDLESTKDDLAPQCVCDSFMGLDAARSRAVS